MSVICNVYASDNQCIVRSPISVGSKYNRVALNWTRKRTTALVLLISSVLSCDTTMYNIQCVVLELQRVSLLVIQLLCTRIIAILSHPIGLPILHDNLTVVWATHINTDHYFTLLNTVSATGSVQLPFFIVANRFINKFKPPIYKLCSSAGEVLIYQHAQYRYYITFSKSGSLSGDIMLKCINKVVANSDHTVYLLLDYAPVHRTMEFKLHCTVKTVQLHYIPANITHILQVNDLVVFAQFKEHLA